MERFLNEEAIERSRHRVRLCTGLLCGTAGLALAFMVAVCLLTRTGNAQAMLYAAMAGMVLGSLAVLALWMFAAEPAKSEYLHLAGLAAVEREVREGRFYLGCDTFRIPKSVHEE